MTWLRSVAGATRAKYRFFFPRFTFKPQASKELDKFQLDIDFCALEAFSKVYTLLEDLPRSLSRLTIDCFSGYGVSRDQTTEAECPSFLLLNMGFISSLRHLHLRSRFICPEIFDTFCSSADSQLESLIVNTSLKVEQSFPPMNKVFFSKQCYRGYSWHDSGDLYTNLRDAANARLPQLTRIKILRILRHKHPSDDVLSYDVLSDRTVILPKNANWEDADCHDDGEADPDFEERSENSFSSSDSDDDSE